MNVKFEASFLHDVKKIREKFVKKQIEGVIEEIEKTGDLTSITNVKKIFYNRPRGQRSVIV